MPDSETEINWDIIDDKCQTLNLEGMNLKGKVTKVYDGDTVHIVLPVFGGMYRWTCRIEGVDTPEIKSKNESEKEKAVIARNALSELILNRLVKVKCGKLDKYGRLLVYIDHDGTDVSSWLIQNNYAYEYDGGTKKSWS